MLQRSTLLPGIRLTAVKSDKFKTATLCLCLVRPLRADEAAMNALLPSVLLRGSRAYPTMRELSRFLETAYGASCGAIVRKRGEAQLTGLYAEFLDDALLSEPLLPDMISLLGGLLLDPMTAEGGFLPEYFAVERDNLRNAMEAEANDKRVYAFRRLCRRMFRGEPFATPAAGDKAELDAVTPQSLYAHYRRILTQSPIEIIYQGSSDPGPIAAAFRDLLSPFAGAERPLPPPPAAAVQREAQAFSETQPLEQSKLVVGFRMAIPQTPAELAAQQVFLAVYGAGPSSRLFLRMREEQSLCYSVSASFDRCKGALFVCAGIDADQYESALREIRTQLAACAAGRISDEELQFAKSQLRSQLRAIGDNPARLEELYLGDAVGPIRATVAERTAAVEAVTAEDVAAAARTVREDTVFFLKGAAE